MRDAARLTQAYETILAEIVTVTAGTEATPERAALALLEMTEGYAVDVAGLFTVFDSEGYDQMIVETGIPFTSLCEHHLAPFRGQAHIAYIPNGKVVGLSKLARLVEAFARRLQIQERLGMQIADALEAHLSPVGTMVVLEAEHSCMAVRGVRKPGVTAVTSVLRGTLRNDGAGRMEALALLRR